MSGCFASLAVSEPGDDVRNLIVGWLLCSSQDELHCGYLVIYRLDGKAHYVAALTPSWRTIHGAVVEVRGSFCRRCGYDEETSPRWRALINCTATSDHHYDRASVCLSSAVRKRLGGPYPRFIGSHGPAIVSAWSEGL